MNYFDKTLIILGFMLNVFLKTPAYGIFGIGGFLSSVYFLLIGVGSNLLIAYCVICFVMMVMGIYSLYRKERIEENVRISRKIRKS